jgi:hypothetical protein
VNGLLVAGAVAAPIVVAIVGEAGAVGACVGADFASSSAASIAACSAAQSRVVTATLAVAAVSAGVLLWAHRAGQASSPSTRGKIRRRMKG